MFLFVPAYLGCPGQTAVKWLLLLLLLIVVVDSFTNELHECLLEKDMVSFWKSWRCKFGGNKPVKVIDELTNPSDITERFADVFEVACRPNNPSKNAAFQDDFENRLMHYETIGADSTGATGNFAPVLTQEPGQTLRFAPVPFMAVL